MSYDIFDVLQTSEDFLESAQMTVGLKNAEAFILKPEENSVGEFCKRSIVLPFYVMYKTKETLSIEHSMKKVLGRNENLCTLQKIILKLTANDSMILGDILLRISNEYEEYQKLPLFNQRSREIIMQASVKKLSVGQIFVLQDTFKIIQEGIQIVTVSLMIQ